MLIRWLALVACVLTLCVTAASAFIRHTQSDLGCQPWPQCQATAREARAQGAESIPSGSAVAATSDAVSIARATHRVSAMLVGLLALAIALFGWARLGGADRIAVAFALLDTLFLAWLGRYTPHDLPLVTIGNVVGGLALAAAFGWIAAATLRGRSAAPGEEPRGEFGSGAARAGAAGNRAVRARGRVKSLAWLGLGLVVLQSALGVMIAARGATAACAQALCLPGARVDPAVFDPVTAIVTASPADAVALHLAHRLVALALVLLLAMLLRSGRGLRRVTGPAASALVCALLLAPLGIAIASGTVGVAGGTLHNLLAGCLWVLLAVLARGGAAADGISSRLERVRAGAHPAG